MSRAGSRGRPVAGAAASVEIELGGLHRRHRRPPHAEVALDRARDRGGGDDLASRGRCPRGRARRRCARRWSRRRRRRRPRRRHPARCLVEAAREQLDARQHDVGRRPPHHVGEVVPGPIARAEVLAADHVRQEHLPDRGRAPTRPRGRRSSAPRCRPGRTASATPRRSAATRPAPRRRPQRRPGRTSTRHREQGRVADQLALLPPSVPPTSSTTSGSGLGQVGVAAVVEAAGEHGHDLATAGQRDPSTGLGRDELLVADDRDPQAAAGAGAGEHLGVRALRATCSFSDARQASKPSRTSVSMVVGWLALASIRPVSRSTSDALVKVDPKSTQTTTFMPRGRQPPRPHRDREPPPRAARPRSSPRQPCRSPASARPADRAVGGAEVRVAARARRTHPAASSTSESTRGRGRLVDQVEDRDAGGDQPDRRTHPGQEGSLVGEENRMSGSVIDRRARGRGLPAGPRPSRCRR